MMEKRLIWLRLLGYLVALGIVFEGLMMLSVYLAGTRNWPVSHTDVAIVLGARVMPDGEMSTTLRYRAEKAVMLYQQGDVDHIIVCGAMGDDEPLTEADAMAAFMISWGIPEKDISRDPDSTDTVENLRHAKAIMVEKGFETATVVTSEYHLTRAMWIARDQGVDAIGAPAHGPDTLPKQVEANFRETLSWMNYWSGGLLSRISGL